MLIPWKSAFFIPLRLITTLGKRPLNCVLLPSAAVIQPPQSSVPAVVVAAASQASHTRPTVYSSDQLRWRRLHTWAPSRTPLMSSSVFPVQCFHMRNRIFSSLLCGRRLGAQRYSPNPCMGTKRCSSVAQFNTLSGLKSQLCDFMSRIQILSGNPALSFFFFLLSLLLLIFLLLWKLDSVAWWLHRCGHLKSSRSAWTRRVWPVRLDTLALMLILGRIKVWSLINQLMFLIFLQWSVLEAQQFTI